ncbi:hypothetical protein IV203_014082 [Nitzschia inconspicua]|uniref:Uncharacterized protein n=1 Tax=Nitzschia inconspicua TaxID=303405 RepID=A0A9K3M6M2_9STRA|nr:hypothetical protein IV203_014082 [Nitzschia inconspicua]
MHHLPPRRGGIGRSDSQVSALSTPSCLFSSCPDEGTENRPHISDEDDDGESSMYLSEAVCNRLRDSSYSHNNNTTPVVEKEQFSRSRRRTVAANTSSKNQKQRGTKNISRISSSSSSKRSDGVVRRLISSVTFKDNGYVDYQDTDGDCNSTVSSLGMGFLYESGDEGDLSVAEDRSSRSRQSDTFHFPKSHSSPLTQVDDHQVDEISNLRSQIRMLRQSSMERFQATNFGGSFGTAKKYDSTPCLPPSPREDGDYGLYIPCTKQQEGSERSSSIPSPTSVTAIDATISVSTTSHIRRRSSLPSDLSKILFLESPSTTMGGSSIASNSALKTTLAPKSRITRTDRWSCTACSETLLRDTELVKQSFERILSLRKERHIKDLELTMLQHLLDTDSEDLSVRPSCSALSCSSSTLLSQNNNSPPTIPKRRSEKLSTTA